MISLKNRQFEIKADKRTGYLTLLTHPKDEHQMNWCAGKHGNWGKIELHDFTDFPEDHIFKEDPLPLVNFSEDDHSMSAEYQNEQMKINVRRFFSANGNFVESVTVKNIFDTPICLTPDNFGFEFPFPDRYTYADDCLIHGCNTHIWCGEHSSWINAMKMGPSEINLGLVLTKGAFDSYSQKEFCSNDRGLFLLNPVSRFLRSGEECTWEWEIFWHSGENFFEKLRTSAQYIGISADHYTVFLGEPIRFSVNPPENAAPAVFCNGETIPVKKENGQYWVDFSPVHPGEYRFTVKVGNLQTHADFNVKIPLKSLFEKRLHFIAEHQQCTDPESPLYGAFLIYDHRSGSMYFDNRHSDHNASRERMNMSILLARYLQEKENPKLRRALVLFVNFIFREIYDENTGEVFNTIGKNPNARRLYNAPGAMLFFCEMYFLTKDTQYLRHILKLADKYYEAGGQKCYSNAVAIARIYRAFEDAGWKKEQETIMAYFKVHVNCMIKNGLSYPKHEVNYEQTIVTPAVNCISEFGMLSDIGQQKKYLAEVSGHLECLNRFSGAQPSCFLHEIAVRYWDDFWFGKGRMMGDTLPHHLSCLTARAFLAYARFSKDKSYEKRAEECLRNCLCLIGDDGRGFAAHVYPYRLNEQRGEFYDEWANDQDLVLYDILNAADCVESFRI